MDEQGRSVSRQADIEGLCESVDFMIALLQEDPFSQRPPGLPVPEHPLHPDRLGTPLLGMLCCAVVLGCTPLCCASMCCVSVLCPVWCQVVYAVLCCAVTVIALKVAA